MLEDAFTERRPYNAAQDLIDTNVDNGLGDKIAYHDPSRSMTYAQLQQRSVQFGAALQARGFRQENRIAVLMPDGVDFPAAFLGAIRAGIVPVTLNTLLTERQYTYMLGDSRVDTIVVGAPLAPMVKTILPKAPRIRTIIVAGGGKQEEDLFSSDNVEVLHFADLLESQKDASLFVAPTLSDEVAFWYYTSGSTGDPKAVKHVHTSPMACAKLMGQGTLGIRSDDVVFSTAKLCFSYGFGNSLAFPLSVGATAQLWPDRVTPDVVFQIMRDHRPTVFYAVPALYAALLASDEMKSLEGFDRLRVCVSAGEALPAQLGEKWRELTGVDILDGIGSTEMLQTFLSNRLDDVKYGASGKPVKGYEAKILDDDGKLLGPGEIGELVIKGPTAGEGYWNQRTKSRKTFRGEWTHTGDKYYCDEDGYFYFCGRVDDMFKVNGMWVSPFDVESALISHDAILEAAVIGREDDDGLIKPKAFLVLKDGHTMDQSLQDTLKDHVKEKAGMWKYPRWIEIRNDLPRTPTGKIQRFKLRQEDQSTA